MTQEASTTQDVDLYSPLDPSSLPDDPMVLKKLLVQLLSLLRKETNRREEVERNMDLLLRKLTSVKSDPASPDQLNLFETTAEQSSQSLSAELALTAAAESEPKRKARPHGRRKPPAHLDELEIVHDLPAELKQELGENNLVPLPDVVSFQYDYRAAKLVVLRHVQKKYLRREPEPAEVASEPSLESDAKQVGAADAALSGPTGNTSPETSPSAEMLNAGNDGIVHGIEERILLGQKPEVVANCEAGPGLLAYIWLSKYSDHLPLYRLETITERYGISFARSTTCDWMMRLADGLRPLWEWMCSEVRRSRVIHTDDTTVPLQDGVARQRSEARFWNYIGDDEHRLTVLEFTRTHERDGPARFLRDYRGYLQADAYGGYDRIDLKSSGGIIGRKSTRRNSSYLG